MVKYSCEHDDDGKSLWVYFQFKDYKHREDMTAKICKAVGSESDGSGVDLNIMEVDVPFSFGTEADAEAAAKKAAAIAGVTRTEIY